VKSPARTKGFREMSSETPESKKTLKRVLIPMDDELLKRIKEYRRGLSPIPSQAETVRQLIEKGLSVAK
jgi:hypothetical protein